MVDGTRGGFMMSKIKSITFIFIGFLLFLPVLIWAGTIQLPQTGQTKCYDSAGTEISCATTGQDGAYTINPMSFTDNGNGTVTDNNINLIFNNVLAGASENIIRASISSIGVEGNAKSDNPSISSDGRYVAFYSIATNLVIGDTKEIGIGDRSSNFT